MGQRPKEATNINWGGGWGTERNIPGGRASGKTPEVDSHSFSRNSKVSSLAKGNNKGVRLWEGRVRTVGSYTTVRTGLDAK